MHSRLDRKSSRLRPIGIWAVFCLAMVARATAAPNLFIETKTDYLPGIDFIGVNITVCERDRPRVCVRAAHPGNIRETAAYASGVRVAEVEVLAGRVHRITGVLVSASGRIVARRQLLFNLNRSGAVATLLFTRPDVTATKTGALAEDRDGDGILSSGDVLRYEVTVRGADRFDDVPGPGSTLIAGSVSTTHGGVTQGNAPGDVGVTVVGLADAGEEDVTIQFDVEVVGVVSNQGVARKNQAAGTPSWTTLLQPTDNPSTTVVGDPTVHAVGCSLADCADALQACEQERDELQGQLTDLTADHDFDGVPAVLELCPNTPIGTAVDERGCSLAEFCARIDTSNANWQVACQLADWQGDEPGVVPQDCIVFNTTCGSP